LSYGLLLQALSAKQEQLWSVCTGFVGIALINPCGLGMLPCVICLQFLVSVSSLNQFYFNDNINGACRNNECPACRTHCKSRRSLRDDPNFDALILALYPDIDKYEEEVIHKLSSCHSLLS
jgi:hypothetical protein